MLKGMQSVRPSRFPAVVVGVAVCLSVGCGSDGRPVKEYKFSPVKGYVLQGDQPLTSGVVQFSPVDDPNFIARGELKSDGAFELTTTMPGKTASGAPEGEYRVTINVTPAGRRTGGAPTPLGIEETYVVKPGQNEFTIRIPQ